jgi:hypothetical protein
VQLAIRGEGARTVFVPTVRKLLARGVQLLEESLETTADASQRGGALFLQFLEKALVLGPRVLDAHGSILMERLTLTSTEAKMPRTVSGNS